MQFRNVYRGIDIVYYGKGGQMEYDFQLAPSANPRQIRIDFPEAKSIRLNTAGDLLIETAEGTIRNSRPLIYQEGRVIQGGYRLDGRTVRIWLGAYDRTRSLVIDPVLT